VTATDSRRDRGAAHAERLAAVSGPRLRLRSMPFVAQTGLRVTPGSAAARRAGGTLGAPLPEAGAVTAAGERRVLWLGPDEWLVLGPPDSEAATLEALAGAVGDEGAAVDLTSNRVALEIAGTDARDVLATCCHLDLHPRAFGPGRCAGTLLGTAQVVVEQTTGEPAFVLLVRPSFLAYVVDWLVAGARSVEAAPTA